MGGLGRIFLKYVSTGWINTVYQLVEAVEEEKGGVTTLPHLTSSPQ